MKKEKNKNNAARCATKILNSVLRVEANSTSCLVAYQPKAPKELSRFKKSK